MFAYVPGPGTIVRGVRQLAPGHLLAWERGGGARERGWWTPGSERAEPRESFASAVAETRELFERSVRRRMISDVPLGVFLSGGVDSTLVANAAAEASSRRLQTFTVGYDTGEVNETAQARRIAERLGSEHHEVTLGEQEVAELAPRLLAATRSAARRSCAAAAARAVSVRPATGDGGARRRGRGRAVRRLPALPLAGALHAGRAAAAGSAAGGLGSLARAGARRTRRGERAVQRLAPGPLLERNVDWVTADRRRHRNELYGPRLRELDCARVLEDAAARAGEVDGSTVRWLMHLDQGHYLPDDVLFKTDRAGMLASLEIRTVFLERELAEFAASLDTATHLAGGGKALLRALLPDGALDASRTRRYRKTAFRVPAAEWLRGPLCETIRGQVRDGLIYSEGYFDRGAATALVEEHLSGRRDHSDSLWPLLSLGLWVDRFLGADAA